MWCTSCAQAIESLLSRRPGVASARVNYVTATALVAGREEAVTLEKLAPRLERLGYELAPLEAANDAQERLETESRHLMLRLITASSFGMWTMLASLLIYAGAVPEEGYRELIMALVSGAFAVPVLGYAAIPFYRAGFRTLLAGRPGMDALVTLGVASAVVVSLWLLWRGSAEVYFDTAVMLVLLLLGGRLVETLSRYRGLTALTRLYQPPKEVTLIEPEGERRKALEQVAVGERLRVASGELLPLDGELVALADQTGQALLDLSPLNGESRAVTRRPGDALQAGCRNLGPPLVLRVSAAAGEGYLDHLYRRMLELHARKGGLQLLADRFAAWLSPLAVLLAVATLLVALLLGVPAEEAVVRALSVLVVACPCAVGLAIPLATMAASSRALEQGVVFRDLAAMESAGHARSAAFDKTGTLTLGDVALAGIEPADGMSQPRVLELAALAEWGSEHPLGRAIRQAAHEQGVDAAQAPPSIEDHAGLGRRVGLADGGCVLVGERDWLVGQGVDMPPLRADEEIVVDVALDGEWQGRLRLTDRPDPQASASLAELRAQGMTLALISGDRGPVVKRIGRAVGFAERECFAAQSPEAKARLVDALPRPSLYVGDGINDVLALASSSVGVAPLGASPQARDAAAVQLLQPGLSGVVDAWRIARQARRVMHQNLVLSGVYNLLALGLVVWMAIPPLVAVLAMAASSLSVVANAARLSWGEADEAPPRQETATSDGAIAKALTR
ncbi:cation-translocating P-type ATPase [Halomonas sp. PA5]|nr:cation-translocating P-type ATPase [Halomonas sp. PA5]